MSETKTKIISQAIGRRREAVASVRIISGDAEITVNGQPVSVYFPGVEAKGTATSLPKTNELPMETSKKMSASRGENALPGSITFLSFMCPSSYQFDVYRRVMLRVPLAKPSGLASALHGQSRKMRDSFF